MKHASVRSMTGRFIAACVLSIVCASSAMAQEVRAFVLSSNSLIALDVAHPSATPRPSPLPVTGLNDGERLVGIDFRPQNGYLYGLGFNSGAGTVQLYAIDYRRGTAAPFGVAGAFVAADGSTPVPIQGRYFGVDFDPTTDRLRVVNDAGQNFRIDPNSGALVDGDLGGPAASVPGLNMDAPIGGAASEVSAAAYTNNEQNAIVTTLYTLRAAANALYLQSPPDGGTQTASRVVTLNGTPLTFVAANGFDIPPGVDAGANNAPAAGAAIAALTVGDVSSLYTIDLATAAATLLGPIGDGLARIQGFAIQGEDVPGGLPAVAAGANTLLRFNTAAAATAVSVAVTDLVAGEVLAGIDWRPQTGQLYGLGFNAANGTGSATLYRLDPQSGAATIIGAPNSIAGGPDSPVSFAGVTTFGFDFEFIGGLTDSRISLVTNNGLNLRVDPNEGTTVADFSIRRLPPGSTGVTAAAYVPGGSSMLYVLDPTSDELFTQGPHDSSPEPLPAAGLLTFVGNVTVGGTWLDFDAANGFDVSPIPAVYDYSAGVYRRGSGYAVLTAGQVTSLYSIDLSSGAATDLGLIGGSSQALAGLAVGDGPTYPTFTTLSSSSNPSAANQSVTLTATVAPSNTTSTVDFLKVGAPGFIDVLAGCAFRPVIGGTATCTTTFPDLGVFVLIARHNEAQRYAYSASERLMQRVNDSGSTMTTTMLTVSPNLVTVLQPASFTASVSPGEATGIVTLVSDGVVIGAAAVVNGVASLETPPAFSSPVVGTHAVTAIYSGDTAFASSTSEPVPLIVTTPFAYFAEGATGDFLHTDLGIFNPSKTDVAHVRVMLLPESGPGAVVPPFALAPLGRATIDVNAAMPATGVSAVVESSRRVAATREVTWGSPVYGSTLESGAPERKTEWSFAEGATAAFSLFFLIENPNAAPANVTLTHLLEGGGAPITETEVVAPFTRRTFFINDVPGLRAAAFSTLVRSDLPIVAERAMYLNTTGRLWEGGTAGLGASRAFAWSFAEGATGFFHTYLLLGNSNRNSGDLNTGMATVTVEYLMTDGSVITRSYDVPGESRRTIDVAGEDPRLRVASFGMKVTSTKYIVAERAMWWGQPWTDGSVSFGATETGTVWAIGEGIEGGPAAESTFVLVSNTSFDQAPVRLTVAYDDGTHEQQDYVMLKDARMTVRIAEDFPNARQRRFSVLVESLLGDPVTVEYARYQSPGGAFADGGGAALATKIR